MQHSIADILAPIVGTWDIHGSIDRDGDVHGWETFEWAPGETIIVHTWDTILPDGPNQGAEIIHTNAQEIRGEIFDVAGHQDHTIVSGDGHRITFTGAAWQMDATVTGDTLSGTYRVRESSEAEWVHWYDFTQTRR